MATSLGSGIWHILNALPFYTVKRAGWSAKADSEAQEKKCVRSFTSLLVAIHVNYELCGKAINIYSATKLTCYVFVSFEQGWQMQVSRFYIYSGRHIKT